MSPVPLPQPKSPQFARLRASAQDCKLTSTNGKSGCFDSEPHNPTPDNDLLKLPQKKDKQAPAPTFLGVPLRWISLTLLTVQTSAQVFIIKWARSNPVDRKAYLASTVVLFTELVKTLVSFMLVCVESGGVVAACDVLHRHCSRDYFETLKVSVPSLLYTVQNNLMFYSLLKLSAAVQQVTYQLKILTTAILSVVILGKVLDRTKWSALFLLLAGVLLIQCPKEVSVPADVALVSGATTATLAGLQRDQLMGFVAVLAACLTSGLASVYLEKLLKQTDASIWVRNVQLGVFGSLMATCLAAGKDGDQLVESGFTQGYSVKVICIILTNALGGLLCAAVLKYADNILRCFSTALSIVLTSMLSACVLQDSNPDIWFVCGAFLAISATFLYSLAIPPLFKNVACAGQGDVCLRSKM